MGGKVIARCRGTSENMAFLPEVEVHHDVISTSPQKRIPSSFGLFQSNPGWWNMRIQPLGPLLRSLFVTSNTQLNVFFAVSPVLLKGGGPLPKIAPSRCRLLRPAADVAAAASFLHWIWNPHFGCLGENFTEVRQLAYEKFLYRATKRKIISLPSHHLSGAILTSAEYPCLLRS